MPLPVFRQSGRARPSLPLPCRGAPFVHGANALGKICCLLQAKLLSSLLGRMPTHLRQKIRAKGRTGRFDGERCISGNFMGQRQSRCFQLFGRGQQVCEASGQWGVCMGQVLPAAAETCGGPDEDCDVQMDESGAGGEETFYRDMDGDSKAVLEVSRCVVEAVVDEGCCGRINGVKLGPL